MTEQTSNLSPDMGTAIAQSGEFLNNTMEMFLSAASVDAVYGKPIKSGDNLIIPAAEVVSGLGYGAGGGGGSSESPAEGEKEEAKNYGNGWGGGGGGRVFSRPVAVIIASPEGVRVEPVVDVTKVALAMFTMVGFMIGMAARMHKPKRDLADVCPPG